VDQGRKHFEPPPQRAGVEAAPQASDLSSSGSGKKKCGDGDVTAAACPSSRAGAAPASG